MFTASVNGKMEILLLLMAHADVNMASEEKRTNPIIAALINGTEIVKAIKQVWKQKIQNIITSINVEITKSI